MFETFGHMPVSESLRALEKRYRLLFERNMAGVLRTGIDGTILEVNDAFARILGFGSREAMRDRAVSDVYFRPADREAMLARLLKERGLSNYELCLRHVDGSAVWVLANIILHEEPSNPQVVQATVIDITERKRVEEELLLFRTLIDRSNDAIEVIDPESGRFLDVNQTACLAHGYTRDEYLTLSVRDVAPTADPAAWSRNLEVLRRRGSRLHVGLHRRKDGSTFPVEVNITYVRLNRDYIVAVVRDITERRRAEEELKRTADLLRAVADETTDAVFVKDRTGKYLLFNAAAARFVGKSVADVLGRDDTEVFDPDGARRLMERDQRIMESGQAETAEEVVIAAGIRRVFQSTKAPYRDGAGNVIGLVGISRDITDRKRAEQAVRQSEERLRQAVRVSNLGIFDHDHVTDTAYWSPEERAIHGWELDRAPSLAEFVAMLHPEDRERIAAAIRRAHDPAGDGTFDVEQRIIRPDGEVRWLVTRSQTYFEGEGDARHPVRTVGAVLDATEWKRLEQQFRQAQKMEAVGQLAGGVAHDFNNLLTVINGLSELALHRLHHDDPSRDLIAEVLRAGERAAGLIRQLMAFSRNQVLQPQVLDINVLLGELSKMLLRLIGEDVGLRLDAAPALGLVKVDPGQFEQAVINLAVNARDAMPQGGRLTIETRNADVDEAYARQHPDVRPGRYVLVAVSDTGHGMDSATRARIFEPFFTTKGLGRGTGLGLAMVYGFVKQTGGHIEVESTVGRGTTFKVYLPCTDEAIPGGRSSQDLVTMPGGAETILLVEDQDAVRSYARHVLLAGGYTVLEARDGEDALAVARQGQDPIHLLVTDVVMPRMSGRQLADLLTRERPEMRVLLMSGHADEDTTRGGVAADGAFLQKPFNPAGLARKVREVLDGEVMASRERQRPEASGR
jgi:PAS domain S-box-containing protein